MERVTEKYIYLKICELNKSRMCVQYVTSRERAQISGGVLGSRSHTVIRTPEIKFYIWRHLLCIYLFTNLMYTITIFNVLRVSLTDSVQYVLIHISLFSFCCCNLLLLLTMSALKCSNFFGNI